MDKAAAIEALIAEVAAQRDRMFAAARQTEQGATDPENRAENKYDTRGLEASYLAAGQGRQIEALTEAIHLLGQASAFPGFAPGDAVGPGALVTADANGIGFHFLLAPAGGGTEFEIDGGEVTALAPGAPLRQKLIGLRKGDQVPGTSMRVAAVF